MSRVNANESAWLMFTMDTYLHSITHQERESPHDSARALPLVSAVAPKLGCREGMGIPLHSLLLLGPRGYSHHHNLSLQTCSQDLVLSFISSKGASCCRGYCLRQCSGICLGSPRSHFGSFLNFYRVTLSPAFIPSSLARFKSTPLFSFGVSAWGQLFWGSQVLRNHRHFPPFCHTVAFHSGIWR